MAALTALILAACGSGGGGTSSPPPDQAPWAGTWFGTIDAYTWGLFTFEQATVRIDLRQLADGRVDGEIWSENNLGIWTADIEGTAEVEADGVALLVGGETVSTDPTMDGVRVVLDLGWSGGDAISGAAIEPVQRYWLATVRVGR